MHQQLCTHCGTLPIPRHWSSQKNVAFSPSLISHAPTCAHAEIALQLVQRVCMCRSISLVDIFILACFVCIQPNRHRTPLLDQNKYSAWWEADGTRPNIGQQRLVFACLVDVANQPPQKCLICWLACVVEISTPYTQALSLSGSLFRDPTLQVLFTVVVAFSTCSIPSFWLASPFSVNSSRHLKGFVSFSYRSAPTSLFTIRSER